MKGKCKTRQRCCKNSRVLISILPDQDTNKNKSEAIYRKTIHKRKRDYVCFFPQKNPLVKKNEESEVKTVFKALGRNTSPGIHGIPIVLFQTTETASIKIITRACQKILQIK